MRPFRPSDLLSLRTVVDAAIAPDGDEFAYTLSAPSGESTLWRGYADTGTPQPLTIGPHDRAPRYAPDASRIAFLRGAPGSAQIHLLDRRGGEAMPFTQLGLGAEEFAWSPDGRAIAVVAPVGADGPQATPRLPWQPPPAARAVFLFQLDGTWRRLSPDFLDCESPAFAPDGRRIVFLARPLHGGGRFLASAPADGGETRTIVAAASHPGPATFSHDGGSLALVAQLPATAGPALCTVAAEGGSLSLYAEECPPGLTPSALHAPVYSGDGATLLTLLGGPLGLRLAEVLPNGRCRLRTQDALTVRRFAIDDAGTVAALVVEEPFAPARFELRDLSGRLQLRSQHEDPALSGVARITPRTLQLASGGAAQLYLPQSAAPAPAVLLVTASPRSFSPEAQALAARGLAVIAAPADDLPSALADALGLPGLDAQRVGLLGEGEEAAQALSLLQRTQLAAAALTSLPRPGHLANVSALPLLLLCGADAPQDLLAEADEALPAAKRNQFPQERGPVSSWSAPAQVRRLDLAVDWLAHYLAR